MSGREIQGYPSDEIKIVGVLDATAMSGLIRPTLTCALVRELDIGRFLVGLPSSIPSPSCGVVKSIS